MAWPNRGGRTRCSDWTGSHLPPDIATQHAPDDGDDVLVKFPGGFDGVALDALNKALRALPDVTSVALNVMSRGG